MESLDIPYRRMDHVRFSPMRYAATGLMILLSVLFVSVCRARAEEHQRTPTTYAVSHNSFFPSSVFIVSNDTLADLPGRLRDFEVTNGGKNCHGQFSRERMAVLFLPGTYEIDVRVPFYMQVAGLGMRPEDVVFTGLHGVHAVNCGPEPPNPHVGVDYADVGALDNFWRSAENLRIAGHMVWATSQAAPLRRLRAASVAFSDGAGWSSGGYAANIEIDGELNYGTQQQAFIRNAKWASIVGLPSFSTVTVGTIPALREVCDGITSVVSVYEAPALAEKPYLRVASPLAQPTTHRAMDELVLAVPPLLRSVRGLSPIDGELEIPLRDVFIATPADSAALINEHLASGRHAILSPGMYDLEEPLVLAGRGQVLLGLGYATLTATHGKAAVIVTGAGARLSGIMVQAGRVYSDVLVQIGAGAEAAAADSHGRIYSVDPIVVHDLFVRVHAERSEAVSARCGTMVRIAADHTIVDHAWLWRADHDSEAHFEHMENPVRHALEVDGRGVTVYGLFAEHTLDDLVVWRGEGGSVYFYQSELAYDAPPKAGWDHAGYVVTAERHTAVGVGVYSYFFNNVSVSSGILARNASGFRHAFTHFLDGKGAIESVLNGRGRAVVSTGASSYVCCGKKYSPRERKLSS